MEHLTDRVPRLLVGGIAIVCTIIGVVAAISTPYKIASAFAVAYGLIVIAMTITALRRHQ